MPSCFLCNQTYRKDKIEEHLATRKHTNAEANYRLRLELEQEKEGNLPNQEGNPQQQDDFHYDEMNLDDEEIILAPNEGGKDELLEGPREEIEPTVDDEEDGEDEAEALLDPHNVDQASPYYPFESLEFAVLFSIIFAPERAMSLESAKAIFTILELLSVPNSKLHCNINKSCSTSV
jgi:hypothetical protein